MSFGVPAGADVVEGCGRTLLPGLIDCHVHAEHGRPRPQSGTGLRGHFTELDMFSDPGLAAQRRSLAASRDDVADIRTAVCRAPR